MSITNSNKSSVLDRFTRPEVLGLLSIVLVFVVIVIAINPVHNFPVEDDWDYSRMVKIFLDTGQIQRSDYAQATLIFPALYGSLVAKIFGFSFTTLRFSTLLLAFIALSAFYALLGELKFDVKRRVLGTLTLLVSPIFIYLSFSFMTDVPALCWLIVSILFYVRALKRDQLRWAILGSIGASLAFLTRQTGALIPIAYGAIVLWRWPRIRWVKTILAGCIIPIGVIAIYLILDRQSTANWATQTITFSMTIGQLAQPEMWSIYLGRFVKAIMTIGMYAVPIFAAMLFNIGSIFKRGRTASPRCWFNVRRIIYAVSAVVFSITVIRLAQHTEYFPYLTDILTRSGLRPYLAYYAWDAGALRGEILPHIVFVALTILAAIAGLALLYFIARKINRAWWRGEAIELQFIFALTLFIAVPSLIFATFYERYFLPLLVGAIILLLEVTRQKFSFHLSVLGLALIAITSWLLMQDYWGWNEARWQVGRELLAQNVPAAQIDAGYEWDGWYLYDATIAYIQATGKPFIFDPWQYVLDPEYTLAFEPMPNYHIERVVDFSTPFINHTFYLQRRN